MVGQGITLATPPPPRSTDTRFIFRRTHGRDCLSLGIANTKQCGRTGIMEYIESCYNSSRRGRTITTWTKSISANGLDLGAQGEAWATIATIHLQETSRFLGRPMRIAEVLQLRVCSRKFVESDPRFLWGGRHLAYFQDRFDWQDVVDYCQSKVGESSHLSGRTLFRALEQHFHVYDPDDD